ncbi:hypothetical protein [Aquimarina brevivitae]|uniref:DUF2846 domain-containing protein n=1 Tax=Aquimarina brevivitae TaxID=323412 RepID=A0A4Q7P0V8_9FLAO|nr:hypothetical protein [Aquimarina brevivitae]RZS93441.1 hypothetical protein EV197_2019 [Aquimarina brevivitae]
MKSLNSVTIIIGIVLLSILNISTIQAQEPTPPSENKAVVYFVRTSTGGALIGFKYFDDNSYIGKFKGRNYLRYECEPGKHTFWATSENTDFIEADLKAGEIYFVEVKAQMGLAAARVKLLNVDYGKASQLKKVKKVLAKKEGVTFEANELLEQQEKMASKISSNLERIAEKKQKKEFTIITQDMHYMLK